MKYPLHYLLLSTAVSATLAVCQADAATTPQTSATGAQVEAPVRSAPSSAFQPEPLPPLPSPPPSPSETRPAPDGLPLPSIEAAPLPLQREPRPNVSEPPKGRAEQRRRDGLLPSPTGKPLGIVAAGDPVLAIGRTAGATGPFRDAIAAAVERNPALAEAEAEADEAAAARREARAGLLPSADINVTGYKTLSRAFFDPQNIIERSRPRSRTDAQLAISQTLLDFGATSTRISAGSARIRAAAAGLDDTAAQVALRTIGSWYDIFTYRTLLSIARSYRESQAERRSAIQQRITQGASAQIDLVRLDSSLASLDTRIARFERQAATAEAQFVQLTGRPVPATLTRAPYIGTLPRTSDEARAAAINVPAVRAANEQATAAIGDARAARKDILPNVSAGIDAGRYGVLETARDYDIRARVTLRQRLGGAPIARAQQIAARSNGAQARASRVREEAARDAAIAWTDVDALNEQTVALEQSYIAARQSRDATEERFRVSRGSVFDVIDANDAYFGAAAAYVESLADRDAAHYVLLARTGQLLTTLQIASAYDRGRQ